MAPSRALWGTVGAVVRSLGDTSVLGFPNSFQIVPSVTVPGEPRRTLNTMRPFPLDTVHSKTGAKRRFGVERDTGRKSEVLGGGCQALLSVCRVTGRYQGWSREPWGDGVHVLKYLTLSGTQNSPLSLRSSFLYSHRRDQVITLVPAIRTVARGAICWPSAQRCGVRWAGLAVLEVGDEEALR